MEIFGGNVIGINQWLQVYIYSFLVHEAGILSKKVVAEKDNGILLVNNICFHVLNFSIVYAKFVCWKDTRKLVWL